MYKENGNKEFEIVRKRLKERRIFLDLSYQDLAKKTGMSKSTLQRYESGGIKNLPYEKIILLAEALEVPPRHFIDLDLSKDYTGEESFTSTKHDKITYEKTIKEFESNAIAHITPKLLSYGYSVEKKDSGSLGDIVATKGDVIWHIDFLFLDTYRYRTVPRHQLLFRFGRIALYNKPITKYSILVQKDVDVDELLKVKPVHLDIKVSILWLNDKDYEEKLYDY